METGEEVYYRVLLNDELKEWIELLRNENDDCSPMGHIYFTENYYSIVEN